MARIQKLRMMPFRGDRNPEHEKQDPDKFQVVRHNWNWGFQEDRSLYPYSFEEAIRKSPTWFREERNRYYLITVIPEGEIRYRSDERDFLVKGNRVLIIPQGTAFYFETTRKAFYHKLSLFVLGVNLSAIVETMGLNRMETIAVPDIAAVIAEMRAIDALLVSHRTEDMPEMAGRTFALLNRLSMMKRGQDENSMLFQMAKARLSSDFEHPLNIADLAAELRVSQSTVDRMFRDKIHISPRNYRIKCKIETAKELLQNTDLSSKEISVRLGYCNQFHFSNEFSRLVGISPNRYRRRAASSTGTSTQ